jgi:hypothetical protein
MAKTISITTGNGRKNKVEYDYKYEALEIIGFKKVSSL